VEDHFASRLSAAPQALAVLLISPLRFSEHLCDPFNNRVDIPYYFGIPKSQNVISTFAQELAPALVLLFPIGVLRTIKFNNQTRVEANEIDKEWTN
jgi:hypothetical protein